MPFNPHPASQICNKLRMYLGRMTEAPLMCAYCVTEPGAGATSNQLQPEKAFDLIMLLCQAAMCRVLKPQRLRRVTSAQPYLSFTTKILLCHCVLGGSSTARRCGSPTAAKQTGSSPPLASQPILRLKSLSFRYFVMAKTDPTKKQGEAFTGFIVERDTPGITVRLPHP